MATHFTLCCVCICEAANINHIIASRPPEECRASSRGDVLQNGSLGGLMRTQSLRAATEGEMSAPRCLMLMRLQDHIAGGVRLTGVRRVHLSHQQGTTSNNVVLLRSIGGLAMGEEHAVEWHLARWCRLITCLSATPQGALLRRDSRAIYFVTIARFSVVDLAPWIQPRDVWSPRTIVADRPQISTRFPLIGRVVCLF